MEGKKDIEKSIASLKLKIMKANDGMFKNKQHI